MAGFFRQGVREYCLLSGSETTRLESNQAEAFMADHHALDRALFGRDDVNSVDRHRVTVSVVLEGCRTGAIAFQPVVVVEVHGRNSSQQGNLIPNGRVVGKVLGAVFLGAQIRVSVRREALQPPS